MQLFNAVVPSPAPFPPVTIGVSTKKKLHESQLSFDDFLLMAPTLPSNIETVMDVPALPDPETPKEGAFVVEEGAIYKYIEGKLTLHKTKPRQTERLTGLINIRDTVRALLYDEIRTTDDISVEKRREHLNKAYDGFIKEFGFINSRVNRIAFSSDPDYPLLLSLEHYDAENETAKKADIFSKRVIYPRRKVIKADTPQEALLIALAETGRVDFTKMSSLTGKSESALIDSLKGLVFKNPAGGWETADEYLSGNVKQKLKLAEEAAEIDPLYKENVEVLRAVQPKPLEFHEIHATLGSPWIPDSDIKRFVDELIGVSSSVDILFSPLIGTWSIKINPSQHSAVVRNTKNTNVWGTSRMNAIDLVRCGLNHRIPTVRDSLGDGTSVVNKEETEAAREKLFLIKEEFKNWIWKDEERRNRLVSLYNERFNNIRLRRYDGSHLTFPGMASYITLNQHQKDGVWRIVQDGTTLLAHFVGSGKTYIKVAAIMERKRLGLSSKAIITVPNHLVEQWGAEFLRLYPLANVLLASDSSFTSLNRRKFIAKIATNDIDAVIIPHSCFLKLPMSSKSVKAYIQQQIDDIDRSLGGIEKLEGEKGRTVYHLKKRRERLEENVKKRVAKFAKLHSGVSFEELGVDMLVVDESDEFKNLYLPTKMTRVAGMPSADSLCAYDLHMKTSWMLHKGFPVVFGTATPISNTMAEMYIIMKYLQPDVLENYGIRTFDAWAANFGEVVSSLEISPNGSEYKLRNRFARFVNLPELLQLFRLVADVQTEDMVKLDIPMLEGGKPQVIVVQPSFYQKRYIEELVKRVESLGSADPKKDNMLKIISDGRKAALDMRLIDPTVPDDSCSKLNLAVENIFRIWEKTAGSKGTQVVFCDMSTPKKLAFNVYEDIRSKLYDLGIPMDEMAFIHEADNNVKKKVLFHKVNSGQVRVIFGSTEKLGTGANIQKHLVALHHIDAPWRPRDVQQREGRILRQGNMNSTVSIYRYVTAGTFDAYIWQTLEVKARFIAQVMTDSVVPRTAEDIEGMVLNYAEVKALASGNPLVKEKFKVDMEIKRLETLKSQYMSEKYRMESQITEIAANIEGYSNKVERLQKDIERLDIPSEFRVTINGRVFADRAEAGNEIIYLSRKVRAGASLLIGSYAGFDLYIQNNPSSYLPLIVAKGEIEHEGRISGSALGTIASLDHSLRSIGKELTDIKDHIEKQTKRLKEIKAEHEKPFTHEKSLERLLKKQKAINKKLQLDKFEPTMGVAEDKESKAA